MNGRVLRYLLRHSWSTPNFCPCYQYPKFQPNHGNKNKLLALLPKWWANVQHNPTTPCRFTNCSSGEKSGRKSIHLNLTNICRGIAYNFIIIYLAIYSTNTEYQSYDSQIATGNKNIRNSQSVSVSPSLFLCLSLSPHLPPQVYSRVRKSNI